MSKESPLSFLVLCWFYSTVGQTIFRGDISGLPSPLLVLLRALVAFPVFSTIQCGIPLWQFLLKRIKYFLSKGYTFCSVRKDYTIKPVLLSKATTEVSLILSLLFWSYSHCHYRWYKCLHFLLAAFATCLLVSSAIFKWCYLSRSSFKAIFHWFIGHALVHPASN